jgi:tetratricopeptide (TPR) repeat protein
MNRQRQIIGIALLFGSLLFQVPNSQAATDAESINSLRQMVNSGQFAPAYQLGKSLNKLVGDPHYDFLFGLAAVNAGHAPEGTLALERHLASVPANDRARLELARAYFEMGEYPRAQQEFEFVLRYNPPKDVQANIQKFLNLMSTREISSSKASNRSYVEIGLGHDSNANSGTYNSQIDLPGGPILLADPTAGENSSSFVQFMAGSQWMKPVDARLAIFASIDADLKHNFSHAEFDIGNLSGQLGFSVLKNTTLYRVTLANTQMWVDNEAYRNTLSVTGDGQFSLAQGLTLNGMAQYAELSHDDDNANRDSRMVTLGGGLQRSLQMPWRPVVGVNASWAHESNLNRREDLSRDLYTLRLTLTANPSERININAGLTHQESEHESADIAFGSVRQDRMLGADIGVNYLWSRHWMLRADAQFTDNDSNQDLYTFRRALFGLRARYLF